MSRYAPDEEIPDLAEEETDGIATAIPAHAASVLPAVWVNELAAAQRFSLVSLVNSTVSGRHGVSQRLLLMSCAHMFRIVVLQFSRP